MWSEENVHISAWDLKRRHKVCNFGLKAEICWTFKWRGRSASHSSKTVGSPVCVLRPPHYFTKRVPAIKERYVWTLPDCIPTSYKRRRWRIKYRLYFYISMSPSLFVQWFNIWHKDLNSDHWIHFQWWWLLHLSHPKVYIWSIRQHATCCYVISSIHV